MFTGKKKEKEKENRDESEESGIWMKATCEGYSGGKVAGAHASLWLFVASSFSNLIILPSQQLSIFYFSHFSLKKCVSVNLFITL